MWSDLRFWRAVALDPDWFRPLFGQLADIHPGVNLAVMSPDRRLAKDQAQSYEIAHPGSAIYLCRFESRCAASPRVRR